MKENVTKSAYILIDMENGFVTPEAAHCIKPAMETVPACAKTLSAARKMGIPVFFVKRLYRGNGSDVELTRHAAWEAGGRACAPGSAGYNSAEAPAGLKPLPGDYSIIKPRWSAFFQTELDLILRRLGIRTVILAGTTTPNCIRTTAYDACALDYNVVVLTDCCSSQTEEIQRVNLADMERIGAALMPSEEFLNYNPARIPDLAATVRQAVAHSDFAPEPFPPEGGGWTDRW